MAKDSLCLVDDRVHDLADVLQVGDERLLVDGVLLQPGQDVLQPGSEREDFEQLAAGDTTCLSASSADLGKEILCYCYVCHKVQNLIPGSVYIFTH